jgi:N-formylglutamate deformylase
MNPVTITEGAGPIILAQPHGGTFVPEDILDTLNETGRGLADTDWHITRLYDGLIEGATIVAANFHRYVIDANRDPSGVSLYPGQNTTGLCPTTDFDSNPIYRDGAEPDADAIEARRQKFHAPYHAALRAEIDRVRGIHGIAILYDCHSIRSDIPFLFDGLLPVFNIGTNDGRTCAPGLEKAVVDICQKAAGYDTVVNGRFKGGWTTRHYGDPVNGVHAIQMELAQRVYMDETPPWSYRDNLAAKVRLPLAEILKKLNEATEAMTQNFESHNV